MTDICTEKQFLLDVKHHKMSIKHDDGVYRHVLFKRKYKGVNEDVHWFELTTWPKHICISGDMGCYVLARLKYTLDPCLEDMFRFFRTKQLGINPIYWSEQLQSNSAQEGFREFSEEKFLANVREHFDMLFSDYSKKQQEDAWLKLDSELLFDLVGESPDKHYSQLMDYEFDDFPERFTDFWEYDSNTYTYHFIWCLRAINWGIRQYDAV